MVCQLLYYKFVSLVYQHWIRDDVPQVKWILGEKLLAMLNELVTETSAGDVSELIKALAGEEIKAFEDSNGVRVFYCWFDYPHWYPCHSHRSPTLHIYLLSY